VENAETTRFAANAVKALKASENALLIVGKMAMSQPQADWIRALAQAISQAVEGRCNLITDGGNSNGARHYGAQPAEGGLDVSQMLANPGKGWLLWNINPALDFDNPDLARNALSTGKVLAVSSFNSDAILANADVILPLAATAESEGTLMSFDGQSQHVSVASKAPGMSKPGWKILHRLGSQLGIEGFDFANLNSLEIPEDSAAVRADTEFSELETSSMLYRLGEVGIYSVNAECRQSEPLQQTQLASRAIISMNPADISQLNLSPGATVTARQGGPEVNLILEADAAIAAGGVLLPAALAETASLGSAWAAIEVEAK
jgi:NADH-quinone oxidoreductase subunit G